MFIRFASIFAALLHTTFTAALPISLKTSDGQLEMVKMTSISSVSYPLSLTELRLTFRNPKDKVIEGRFQVVLPSGASVARFAMAIGNEWREGEVVERKFARKVYENFLLKKGRVKFVAINQSISHLMLTVVDAIIAKVKEQIQLKCNLCQI